MRAAAFGLIALTSCSVLTTFDGFVGQGSPDGGSSQNTDGSSIKSDALADSTSDASTCDLSQPFGAPVLVAGLNTPAFEGSARFSPDELTVYFESDRAGGLGGYDIWVATRATRDAAFGTAIDLAAVNTPSDDNDPAISEDGLTLIVSQMANTIELVSWTRATTAAPFGNATPLTALDPQNVSLFQASFGERDQVLCFNIDNQSLACAPRASDGTFGAPVDLPAFENQGDSFPTVSSDGLSFYYSNGNGHVCLATRSSVSADFGTGNVLTNVAVGTAESPDWISPDGCRLYVEAYDDDGGGSKDIFVASRP